jgi:hypothetical protein
VQVVWHCWDMMLCFWKRHPCAVLNGVLVVADAPNHQGHHSWLATVGTGGSHFGAPWVAAMSTDDTAARHTTLQNAATKGVSCTNTPPASRFAVTMRRHLHCWAANCGDIQPPLYHATCSTRTLYQPPGKHCTRPTHSRPAASTPASHHATNTRGNPSTNTRGLHWLQVMSRCFGEGEELALAPYIDLINHEDGAGVPGAVEVHGQMMVYVSSSAGLMGLPMDAGDELYIDYVSNCAPLMAYLSFGFVPPSLLE